VNPRQAPRPVRNRKPALKGGNRNATVARKTTHRCSECGDRVEVPDRRDEREGEHGRPVSCSCGATTIDGRRVVMATSKVRGLQPVEPTEPEPEPEPVEPVENDEDPIPGPGPFTPVGPGRDGAAPADPEVVTP
jgi:hypothetical protein